MFAVYLFSVFLFWFLVLTGYVYSSFLRPYNPAKVQKAVAENGFGDDFDDISLFVSSRPPTDSSTKSPGYKKSDSSSPFHFCENTAINGTGTGALPGREDQHVSMIHTMLSSCCSYLKPKIILLVI